LFQAVYPDSSAGTDCYPYLTLLQKRVCNAFSVTKKAVSSYLTISPLPKKGGLFSVALSLSSHSPGVTWFFFQRSPDFPLDYSSDHRTIYFTHKIFFTLGQ